MPRLATAALGLLLVGCVPGTDPAAEPPGPALVIDVRNASDRQLDIGFDFTTEVWNGSGATLVEPCQRNPITVGKVGGGTYAVHVEGKTVVDAAVPASAPEDATLVVGLLIGPDGTVDVLPSRLVEVPELDITPIPCG
jgi:hypothetical protein